MADATTRAGGGGGGGPEPGRLDLWRDPAGMTASRARELAEFLELRARTPEEVATRGAYLDLLAPRAGGLGAVREFRKTYGTWSGAKSGIAMGAEVMQINGY